MRILGKVLCVIAAWALLLALLIGSIVMISFMPSVYKSEQEKLNIPETVGCSSSVLDNITGRLIGFMKGGANAPADLNMNAQINGENREVFSNEEKYHMYDVKYLFDLARYVMMICFVVALLASGCALAVIEKGKKLRECATWLLWGMASFVVAATVFAVIMAIDFQKFWIAFHQTFFTNDLWQLDPSKDVLIQMMPQQFFQNMILKIGLTFAACAGAIAIAAGAAVILDKKKLADGEPEKAKKEPKPAPKEKPEAKVKKEKIKKEKAATKDKNAKVEKSAPSDETVTAIRADDGERFVLNNDGEQDRPDADEIFEGFGLSDKDDQPLLPDEEAYTTRPLAPKTAEQAQVFKPEAPAPETPMQFVMPQSTGSASFEPERLYKLSDEPSGTREAAGLTFSGGNGADFTDISSSVTSFKFADEHAQEGEDPSLPLGGAAAALGALIGSRGENNAEEPLTLSAQSESVSDVAPEAAPDSERNDVAEEQAEPTTTTETAPDSRQTAPVAPTEPIAQPAPTVPIAPIASPEPSITETAPPVAPLDAAAPMIVSETNRVARADNARTIRPRRAAPRYIDDEPQTAVYTPGEERPRRVAPQPRSLSVNVPMTIPASQMALKSAEGGMKLELKLELRLLEDGSLAPAFPQETQRVQTVRQSEPAPEIAPEPEPEPEQGPSITELLSRMDQIMASFPGDEGNDNDE